MVRTLEKFTDTNATLCIGLFISTLVVYRITYRLLKYSNIVLNVFIV